MLRLSSGSFTRRRVLRTWSSVRPAGGTGAWGGDISSVIVYLPLTDATPEHSPLVAVRATLTAPRGAPPRAGPRLRRHRFHGPARAHVLPRACPARGRRDRRARRPRRGDVSRRERRTARVQAVAGAIL